MNTYCPNIPSRRKRGLSLRQLLIVFSVVIVLVFRFKPLSSIMTAPAEMILFALDDGFPDPEERRRMK